MSKRTLIIVMLVIAIVISFGIMEIIALSRGGSLAGTIRINNFTLCQADKVDGTPQPLTSLILKPTTVVHACGYLEVSLIYPSDLCLAYGLFKNRESVYRPYTRYCVPWRSQYISFPVTTTALLKASVMNSMLTLISHGIRLRAFTSKYVRIPSECINSGPEVIASWTVR